MDAKTTNLIASLRALFPAMSEDARVAVLDALAEGYCIHCGREEDAARRCQCWNDK